MYESLVRHCDSFHLYMYALDDRTAYILESFSLKSVTIIPINQINDSELLELRSSRTNTEFCWTCESAIIVHAIEEYELSECTYIDSDIYFWESPEILISEMGNNSVIISPHRYSSEYEQTKTSGRYCIQLTSFRNTQEGMKALRWWKAESIKWCYSRFEDGKFGGQKYLDDWLERFEKVHELQHLGGGVAPWNVQQYELKIKNDQLTGIEKTTGIEFPLVFYHFHALKYYTNGRRQYTRNYILSPDVIKYIYVPYCEHLEQIRLRLTKQFGKAKYHGEQPYPNLFRRGIRYLKRKISSVLNGVRKGLNIEINK